MAENKNAKKAAAAVAAAEETTESTPAEHARKQKKMSRWTLATCMRASKRFTSRDEWAHGAPSSFKAAVAKGWDTDCCKHMTVKTSAARTSAVKTRSVAVKKAAAGAKKKPAAGRSSKTA